MNLSQFKKMYLDYFNNFLTIEAFADHWGITVESAKFIRDTGHPILATTLQNQE